MSWHASDDMLRRYARGETGMALTASVEAHLLRCGVCRGRLAPAVDAPLEAAWTGVLDAIQAPPAPHLVRVLRRLGLRDADGVLLAAARAVSGAWTLATLAVVVFAALATFADAGRGLALYLLVAPLVPVVGVVAAFGATDPLVELASTTPYSKARLAALRTAAVLVTGVPLSILVGLAGPNIGWLAFAWLLPALVLTLATLVAMTWWAPEPAGIGVAAAWVVVIAVAYASRDVASAVSVELQAAYLVLAALAAVALALRIGAAHTPGGHA